MVKSLWTDWPKLLDAGQIQLELKFKNPLHFSHAIWLFSKLFVIKVNKAYSEIILLHMYLLLNERIPHTLTSSSVAQELASECPYLKVSIFFLSEEWYYWEGGSCISKKIYEVLLELQVYTNFQCSYQPQMVKKLLYLGPNVHWELKCMNSTSFISMVKSFEWNELKRFVLFQFLGS